MALRYINGFDYLTAATGSGNKLFDISPSEFFSGSAALNDHCVTETMPVLGTRGAQFRWKSTTAASTSGTGVSMLSPVSITSGSTYGFGFHLYMTTLPNEGANARKGLIGFGSSGGNPDKALRLRNTGVLEWRSGGLNNGSALADSGSNVLTTSTLYHIEMKILFHASAGSLEVRVNGTPWITATGIATLPSPASYISFVPWNIGLGTGDGDGGLVSFDNFYIWDDQGSTNNDFLGERTVLTVFPDQDTPDADWTLSTGSDGYDLINDVPAGSEYLESSAVDNESKFLLSDPSTLDIEIVGIQTSVKAQKTASGTSEISFGLEYNSAQDYSAPIDLTQDQYLYFHHMSEENPDTEAPWAPSDISNLLVGIKQVS